VLARLPADGEIQSLSEGAVAPKGLLVATADTTRKPIAKAEGGKGRVRARADRPGSCRPDLSADHPARGPAQGKGNQRKER